jgi:hypothetical protein
MGDDAGGGLALHGGKCLEKSVYLLLVPRLAGDANLRDNDMMFFQKFCGALWARAVERNLVTKTRRETAGFEQREIRIRNALIASVANDTDS